VNGKYANSILSQWKGSPHGTVPIFVPTPRIEGLLAVNNTGSQKRAKRLITGNI
jgi:hypothetical protein